MAENGTPQHPKHTDTHSHYPTVKCSRERHSLPFDAPGAILFACGTVGVIRVQKQRGCPPPLDLVWRDSSILAVTKVAS